MRELGNTPRGSGKGVRRTEVPAQGAAGREIGAEEGSLFTLRVFFFVYPSLACFPSSFHLSRNARANPERLASPLAGGLEKWVRGGGGGERGRTGRNPQGNVVMRCP